MACRIAAAQIEVGRARRARAEIFSATPLNEAALARAEATHRYERRALAIRKRAIRQLDAASAPESESHDGDSTAPAALGDAILRDSTLRWSPDPAGDRRCDDGFYRLPSLYADPYAEVDKELANPYAEVEKEFRRIARLFGHTKRNDLEYFGRTNPRRSRCRSRISLNEPEASPPSMRVGQTNPSRAEHCCTTRSNEPKPNELKPARPNACDLGQTNPRPGQPEEDAVFAERTQARDRSSQATALAKRAQGGANCVRHRQTSPTRCRPAVAISAKRTRGAGSSRDPRRERTCAILQKAPRVSIGRLPHLLPRRADRCRAPPKFRLAYPGYSNRLACADLGTGRS